MSFVVDLGSNKLKITDNVIKIITKYRQSRLTDFEAGGILIARQCVETENIIIEFATEPMEEDYRSRTSYNRRDQGHVEYFDQLYKSNNGIYGYIGEWHTHPESIPNYSGIDSSNWARIAKDHDKKMKYYHIILGIKNLCLWEYTAKEKALILMNEVMY